MAFTFPEELKNLRCWVVWKGADKKPYSAITMRSDGWQKPENWTTFKDAVRIVKETNGMFKGVGFVPRFPYVVIDLDHCIEENGMMNDFAREITNQLDTFAEYSMSNTGLHIFCKVTQPFISRKIPGLIEVFATTGYIACTGKSLDENQEEVTDQTENLKLVIEKHFPKETFKPGLKIPEQIYEGEGRDNYIYKLACSLRSKGLGEAEILPTVLEVDSMRCKPPLGEAIVIQKVKSACKYDPGEIKNIAIPDVNYITGRRDLEKHPYEGVKALEGSYIPTGIPTIDYAINDLSPGSTTLITGRSNEGKTTYARQIIANAIDKGNKVYCCMGENNQTKFLNSLYRCVIGRIPEYYDEITVNKRTYIDPKKHVLEALQKWHYKKLVIFDKAQSNAKTMDDLFNEIEKEIRDHGHNLVVIDNLMSVLVAKALEKNEAQGDFMQRCHGLAIKYKIHIILILHPNKEYRAGQKLAMEHIAGSSDLYNKADFVLHVAREDNEEQLSLGINGCISVKKNRDFPERPECELYFDEKTGMLLERKEGRAQAYRFNWEKYLEGGKVPWYVEMDKQLDQMKLPWEDGEDGTAKENL